MGLFGRNREKSFFDRFPKDRFGNLPTLLGASLRQYALDADADDEKAWTCRFFLGYLLGYPSYVDKLDPESGAAVRMFIFTAIFGEEEAGVLHQRATGHLMLSDAQTQQGAVNGELDGSRYFRALEDRHATSDATLALQTGFQMGWIDIDQQV